MTLEQKIKEWVVVDNQVKLYQEKIRELRNIKFNISNQLLKYAEENNIEDSTIIISDGKLRFQTTKLTPPLTFKYIKHCLTENISNEREVNQIIDHIKKHRDIQYKKDIKRYYTKTN